MFNFIVTVGGRYDQEYANKSVRMLRRNCKIPFNAYCLTDYNDGFDPDVTIIRPELTVKGWWNKMLILSRKMPKGWILVMDVDLIINSDMTEIIEYAMNNTRTISAYSDAICWENCKLSTSLMMFQSGSLDNIYQKFIEEYPGIENFPGGDQGWLYTKVKDILYLDEIFPGFKKSLKFNISSKNDLANGKIVLPLDVEDTVKIIDCHGNPKPKDLYQVGWTPAVRNWI